MFMQKIHEIQFPNPRHHHNRGNSQDIVVGSPENTVSFGIIESMKESARFAAPQHIKNPGTEKKLDEDNLTASEILEQTEN